MHRRSSKRALSALATTLLLASTAFADPPAAPPPAPPRAIYRLDVAVTGLTDGAPATWSLMLQEGQISALSTGVNLALSPAPQGGPAPRQDVGLSLHMRFVLRGDVVVVDGGLETSSLAPSGATGATAIRRLRLDGVTALTGTQPALLGSVFEIATRQRVEVTVAAHRVL